jgi:phosphate transport system substrate-binding protein
MSDIARRFKNQHAGVAIDVQPVGSGQAIATLRAGRSDIAMLARALSPGERDLFAFPVCRDGAAIIVHRNNRLKGLNRQQLSQVLTGQITDWTQLGVQSGPIKLAWRPEGHAIAQIFLGHLNIRPEQVRSHSILPENSESIRFVANDPAAIAVAAVALAERSIRSGAAVKLLAYEGVPASSRTIRNRTYVLSRPLVLATRSVPTGLQQQFIDYALSSAVADVYDKHGFIPYQD